jgi:acetyl-CoA carboxylase beta subunit
MADEDMKFAKDAPIQKLQHAGTSYFVKCPYCGEVIFLTYEREGNLILCQKCVRWIKLTPEKEEEKQS